MQPLKYLANGSIYLGMDEKNLGPRDFPISFMEDAEEVELSVPRPRVPAQLILAKILPTLIMRATTLRFSTLIRRR